jgi:hypothetical protein
MKYEKLQSTKSITKVSVELDSSKTNNTMLNILNPDNTSEQCDTEKSIKDEAIDQIDTSKEIMVHINNIYLFKVLLEPMFFNVIRKTKNSYV